GFRQLATVLDFVKINDGFDGFLLAEKETLSGRFAFFVTLKPPFKQPAGDDGGAGITGLPPCFYLFAEFIGEFILLGVGGKAFKQAGFFADNATDTAADGNVRSDKTHGRPAFIDKLRASAGQKLVMLVRLGVGVANNDFVNEVGHACYSSLTTVD